MTKEDELIKEYGLEGYNEYIKLHTYYMSLGYPDPQATNIDGEFALVHPNTGYVYLADRLEYFIWVITRKGPVNEDDIIKTVFNNQGRYNLDVTKVKLSLENMTKAKILAKGLGNGIVYAKTQLLSLCKIEAYNIKTFDKLKAAAAISKSPNQLFSSVGNIFKKKKLTEIEKKTLNYFATDSNPYIYGLLFHLKDGDDSIIIDNAVEAVESLFSKNLLYIKDCKLQQFSEK